MRRSVKKENSKVKSKLSSNTRDTQLKNFSEDSEVSRGIRLP